MIFECFECLKALTSPITCGFRSLILKGSFFWKAVLSILILQVTCTSFIPSLREGTYNYLIKGGRRAMVKKGKEGKEMGRAMKFFRIKMKNKMSIVKGNHGKKGKK